MKVILSRKGFDSSSGGCASPIFPNDRYYSLPIPYEEASQKRYADVLETAGLERSDMGSVVEDLTEGQIRADRLMHLDPDLNERMVPRLPGWRPAFGQAGTQQTHLANEGVGVGDLFLYFGWFAEVERGLDGRWRHQPGTDISAVFGWLQVGEVIHVEQGGAADVRERRPWLCDHPHVNVPESSSWGPNTIYVASDRLRLKGASSPNVAGAGVFRSLDPRLVLTAPNQPRSFWKLPSWFKGGERQPWLTNYVRPEEWTDTDGGVLLRPVGRRGQEAVLDCRDRPEAARWIANLLECGAMRETHP